MMSTTAAMIPEVTSESRFALEPFLPVWSIVLLGVLLLGFSCWMARRDTRFVAHPKRVWLLLLLRSASVLILLWMLAGPTLVTTVRKFKRKSIAVLVDTSASMGLVEVADGSGNISRWAASHGGDLWAGRLREIDSAVATLLAAQHQLARFGKLPESADDSTAARALLSDGVEGIAKGLELVKTSSQILPGNTAELKPALLHAAQKIENGSLAILREKSAAFRGGKSLSALEREHWLPKQLEQLSLAVTTIQRLVDGAIKSAETPVGKSSTRAGEEAKRSRLEKVEGYLASAEAGWLKELAEKAAVHRYEFGDKVLPVGASGAGELGQADAEKRSLSSATELGAALQAIALANAAEPLAAAIVITDGGQNAGRDPREIAPSLTNTALHLVPIGNTQMERDVILHNTHAPKAVLQNDTMVIESMVTAFGCAQETLQLQLLERDTVIDQKTLNVTGEVFDTRVQMRWKASILGKHSLTVRIAPVSDERTQENNSSTVDVRVMEARMRVLVADNFPRWETRYLLNLFKRDERVAFDQLLFEPLPVRGEGALSRFPMLAEDWLKYRVVILGDVLPSQLGPEQQKLLRDYVTEAGGNLILVAGRDAMPAAYGNEPLGALLPVLAGDRSLSGREPFYLHVADEGSDNLAIQIAENPAASERIWHEMSERMPIYALSEFSKPKPTTHSLIWAGKSKTGIDPGDPSTRSFLTWHNVGAGRVVYLAAPVAYQLRYRNGDAFHHRFWGQLLRWIVTRDLAEGSQTVRLSTDKLRYEAGEPVQVTAQLRQLDGKVVSGATLQIEAWHADNLLQNITLKEDASRPGNYHAALAGMPMGLVRLNLLGDRVKELLASENYSRPLETTITVDPHASLELRNPLCNLPLLREIAEASGGMMVPPTGLEAALRQLNLEPESSETISKAALWARWDLFYLFLGCLSLEWAGRKYLGLS
jgi:hypothetical protein